MCKSHPWANRYKEDDSIQPIYLSRSSRMTQLRNDCLNIFPHTRHRQSRKKNPQWTPRYRVTRYRYGYIEGTDATDPPDHPDTQVTQRCRDDGVIQYVSTIRGTMRRK